MNKYSMEQDIFSLLKDDNTIEVPEKLFAFEGHFPNNPIVPGIYTLELAVECLAKKLQKKITLKKINRCKFNQPVLPGMKLKTKITLVTCDDNLQKAKIQFFCKENNVLDANIIVEINNN